jgi:hypothetical protein
MNKEQSDAVSAALLGAARNMQAQRRARIGRLRAKSRKYGGVFGMAGFLIGLVVGHLVYGRVFSGGVVGLVLGLMVGYLVTRGYKAPRA